MDTTDQDPQYITLLYDPKLKRPGCVLLQAVAGGDHEALYRFFTADDWLVHNTPDMVLMHGTEEQWNRVATTPKLFRDARRAACSPRT